MLKVYRIEVSRTVVMTTTVLVAGRDEDEACRAVSDKAVCWDSGNYDMRPAEHTYKIEPLEHSVSVTQEVIFPNTMPGA